MTATAPQVKGWCPGALRPMLSGDGLVVRIRPRLAELSLAQAAGIADLAMVHGNGFVQLTNRANLQIRGVAEAGLPALTEGLNRLQLLDGSPEAEARRNIVVNPFWLDPGEGSDDETADIANALAERLAARDAPALGGKFGFAVDVGHQGSHLADISADIRIEAAGRDLIVRADGAALGRKAANAAEAVDSAIDLARWFVASGGGGDDGRGRMRAHLARGQVPPPELAGDTAPNPAAPPCAPGPLGNGHCVGFAFGQIPASHLLALAIRTTMPIRITPWRSLFVQSDGIGIDLPNDCDFILSPNDPLLRVTACTGAPGCPQAHGETRALARDLAQFVPPGGHLHVSGCAKGCAHPGAATTTLVAGPSGFALIRNGSTRDTAIRNGLATKTLTSNPFQLFGATE